MPKISAKYRLIGSCSLLLLSVLLNLTPHYTQSNPQMKEIYPFYNWRLMPFPDMDTPKERIFLVYQKQKNLRWEVFSLGKYRTQFGIYLKKYETKNCSIAELKENISNFFSFKVYSFKIVKEIYYPQQIIRGQHEVLKEDYIVFD